MYSEYIISKVAFVHSEDLFYRISVRVSIIPISTGRISVKIVKNPDLHSVDAWCYYFLPFRSS